MPKFIVMFTLTQKGMENVEESPDRVDVDKEINDSFDVEVQQFYKVWGEFDILLVVEAPDAESLAKSMLTISERGAVSHEIVRAFDEEEYREIIEDVQDAVEFSHDLKPKEL